AARAASRGEKTSGGQTERRVSRCVEWLRQYLGSGGKPAAEAEVAGEAEGFTKAMLFRARGDLGVVSRRAPGGGKAVWYWYPADAHADGEDEVNGTFFDEVRDREPQPA